MSAGLPTLRCCACGQSRCYDPFAHRCEQCGAALEFPRLDADLDLPPPMPAAGSAAGMWQYRALLPRGDDVALRRRVFMGEGGTPLLRSPAVEAALRCDEVWLKDESRNPTGSFKDRGTALAVGFLARLGCDAVGTVSTGNMARSVAAYAARAGMGAHAWVGASTPADKLAPVLIHGARLRRIDAPYGDIYEGALAWSRGSDVPFVNSDSALRVEGQKTIAYEIAEQLGGRAPDWLLVPTSSGGNFSAIAKGFAEFRDRRLIAASARLVAVQTAQCEPIVRAWRRGAEEVDDVPAPTTIAGAISNPSPPSGARALRWLRATDGVAVAVPDVDIACAQRQLAALTGRFVQPASAATLAALRTLRADGTIAAGDSVVLLLTGAGSNAPPPDIEVPPVMSLAEACAERGELTASRAAPAEA